MRITPPASLPFLRSLLWQTSGAVDLTPEEMLNVYERGWRYRDTLEPPTPEELNFIHELAAQFHSAIIHDVALLNGDMNCPPCGKRTTSPALLSREKGARNLVPSPVGRGLG